MTIYIVEQSEDDVVIGLTEGFGGFGWRDLDSARAELEELKKHYPDYKIYEVTISAKEIS